MVEGQTPSARIAAGHQRTAVDASALQRRVTVDIKHATVEQAIQLLATAANVRISYTGEQVEQTTQVVTLHASALPLGDALDTVLRGTGLHAEPLAADLVAIKAGGTFATVGIIKGTVKDEKSKAPLRGAMITVDDATRGVITDADGAFRVAGVSAGEHRITVRLLGYVRNVQRVTVSDDATQAMDITLAPSARALDQVVVTGTVIATALKAVPSAITVITAKDIEQRGITAIQQLFRGDVPGVFASNQGGSAPFDEVQMFSRGASALSYPGVSAGVINGTNPMKTYVDGIEIADPQYLSQIDPKSIERIEILTGPQASTIYGSNALNGVMQIFTKRGATTRPQLTLNLQSGFIQSTFSPSYTPEHDYSAQLSGVEGRISYNGGTSWQYTAPWTPSKQTSTLQAFGGARMEYQTPVGAMTADVSLRRTGATNWQRGDGLQLFTHASDIGQTARGISDGAHAPTVSTLAAQTLGLTLTYAPTHWWSNEATIGQDVEDRGNRTTAPGYLYNGNDTMLTMDQTTETRRSIKFSSTLHIPVTSLAQATLTGGADAWQSLYNLVWAQPAVLTGTLSNVVAVIRQPAHNTGGFVQGQLAIADQLFLTYGLRAEWNPNFGKEAEPNYAPRYGVALTHDLGPATAKLRASYGRSTRPPGVGLARSQTAAENGATWLIPDFGNYEVYQANPGLTPEDQQGGEGGLELYLGTRASLVVTRYNQTVDNLIAGLKVDSVQRLDKNPDPFGLCVTNPPYCGFGAYNGVFKNVNVGAIRNQGWETQGSVTFGPLTTRGTYSWTKSRTMGINARYRSLLALNPSPQFVPGAIFQYLPEHTWALSTTYAVRGTTVMFSVNGTGALQIPGQGIFGFNHFFSRDRQSAYIVGSTAQNYIDTQTPYTRTDLTASHHITSAIEAVLDVKNLGNQYQNDVDPRFAILGRQTKGGLRIRW